MTTITFNVEGCDDSFFSVTKQLLSNEECPVVVVKNPNNPRHCTDYRQSLLTKRVYYNTHIYLPSTPIEHEGYGIYVGDSKYCSYFDEFHVIDSPDSIVVDTEDGFVVYQELCNHDNPTRLVVWKTAQGIDFSFIDNIKSLDLPGGIISDLSQEELDTIVSPYYQGEVISLTTLKDEIVDFHYQEICSMKKKIVDRINTWGTDSPGEFEFYNVGRDMDRIEKMYNSLKSWKKSFI